MRLIDELKREHELIDPAVGSFRTWAERFAEGDAPAGDGRTFIDFFVVYADAFHHEREEQVLCPALIRDASLPERGPIAVLLADHDAMGVLIAELRQLLTEEEPGAHRERVRELVAGYSRALWHHIDAENSVFLPESEARLERAGIRELESREATAEELRLAGAAEELVRRYPPFNDREIVRGEGCIMCPAFAETCRGIEREWWNQWEWEEHGDRIAAS